MANLSEPFEYPVDPYLLAYFRIVAPRRSAERWRKVEPLDIWDELGDFA